MLEEKRIELTNAVGNFDHITLQKERTLEMLEERRKKDEEKYLQPILEKESLRKQELDAKTKELFDAFMEELIALEGVKFTKERKVDFDNYLDLFVYLASIGIKLPKELLDKTKIIYDYFLSIEDIESAVTFLKVRSGSFFRESEISEKRESYIRYLAENPEPVVEQNSKYILGYGEYVEDIVKLFEVCGRMDRRIAPRDFKGVYYSEKTALLMAMGALDEFGDVAKHLYYVPPFGTQDSDRETLVYYHNKGYFEEEEKEEAKSESKEKPEQE